MKELSIEEKAKAYDEALERAKMSYHTGDYDKDTLEMLEIIFPELKESEDERIREDIISFVEQAIDAGYGIIDKERKDKWISWLEKQGDNADKVEPKFKVGDWVIDKQGIVHQIANVIENVTNHTYGYDIVGGGYFNDNTEGVRLWTIQDAKDGDVLKEDSCIFIVKKINPNGTAIVHCCLFDDGDFDFGSTLSFDVDSTYPATKEQRDLLFQKIKEAGYEWDSEKKELKKIEKKPVIVTPKFKIGDKVHSLRNRLECTIESIDRTTYYGDTTNFDIKDQDDWKLVEQKPVWSERDSKISNAIIKKLGSSDALSVDLQEAISWVSSVKDRVQSQPKQEWSKEDESIALGIEQIVNCASLLNIVPDKVDKIRTWLKSIKDRVKPQPKQEWNKEDESYLNTTIAYLKDAKEFKKTAENCINWLKSLRLQNTWKPSDEQMTQLGKYCPDNRPLTSLYEQLKKLREE